MAGHQPWIANYPAGLSWDEPLPPPFPLHSVLTAAADRWPKRIAIDFYDQLLTFRQLLGLAARTAKGLQAIGVGPNVNVALHLPNTPHFVIGFFGILLAGGRVVNLNPHGGLHELQSQLADTDARVLITADWLRTCSELPNIAATAALKAIVICRMRDFLPPELAASLVKTPTQRSGPLAIELDFRRLIANDGTFLRQRKGKLEETIAVIQHTGATTGEPKGAMLTHANFAAVIHILGRCADLRRSAPHLTMPSTRESSPQGAASPGSSAGFKRDGSRGALPAEVSGRKVLCVLPLSHIYGLGAIMLPTLAAANELVLHLRFDVEHVLNDISGKRVSSFAGVPTMFSSLINHARFRDADLSSIASWSTGGAPLPAVLREQIETTSNGALAEGYALTETTGLGTLPLYGRRAPRAGEVGLPAPLTLIEVVDLQTGLKVLPIGEVGEICISGPQVMQGYWNRPDENREAFRGGRFHTGDVGFIDANGVVTLTDRKKQMLLIGAHNVYPANIERAIHAHADVAEVAVIGVHDPHFGQVPKAIIALKPGSRPFTHGELCGFLAKRLASYELPAAIEFRAELPKTAAGKVAKRDLIEEERAKALRSAPLRDH
jgi:long-chain acyl-CoA synthetase